MIIVSSLARKGNLGRWILAFCLSHRRDLMKRFRFTLAQLMTVVLYVGFGFAALRNADRYWADATYTIAIISIAAALLSAIVRQGTARVPWMGYAIFGWTYVLLDLLPSWTPSGFGFERVVRPKLLAMWGIGRLYTYINTSQNLIQYDQISYSLGMIVFGLIGSFLARFLATRDDRPIPRAAQSDSTNGQTSTTESSP
jgi:uncharacterized membrane protein